MGDLKVSPLAPPGGLVDLPVVDGVRFAAVAAGVKYAGRDDVMLIVADAGSTVAGVFTQSATRAAPVLDCQDKIADTRHGDAGLAVIVNSGNANAFTGHSGEDTVGFVTRAVADELALPVERVYSASTGVIGEPLPHDRITAKIAELVAGLDKARMGDAARAFMTTDTFPKGAARTIQIDGQPVQIAGIAKGSGMIAPDMATMLVYIVTDAAIGQGDLQAMLARLNAKTFNCITVDSDTSTSDTLMVIATGKSGVNASESAEFESALHAVMLDLAHQVVRDGEGASKFVTVNVTGAASDGDARKVAFSIANSPLVKTAIAGEDPNWGRVVMAVGKSGAAADRDRLSISFGDIPIAVRGWVSDTYREEDGAAYMKGQDITITTDLGLADGSATVWTCDLTHAYISINADYRS